MTRWMLVAVALVLAGCSRPADETGSEAADGHTAITGPIDTSDDGQTVMGGRTADAEAATTEEAALKLGDRAPRLTIASWFQGAPIDEFQEGSIYVVEFWATWCGPCKQTMPHINELQAQYGDEVKFLGVTDETEQQVVAFFESDHPVERDQTWADIATYTIALDENRETLKAYMEAARQEGIPTAFVVGRTGVIEWIGHPMALDQPLTEIRDGTWDVAAAREAMETERRIERQIGELRRHFEKTMAAGEQEKALAVLDEMTKVMPENPQIGLDRFAVLLELDRTDEAYDAIEGVIDSLWEHADFLEYLAVHIADELPEERRRMDVARRVAQRALELTNRSTGALDALARVRYRQGDLQQAIELQREAVETAGQPEGDFQDRLEFYLDQQSQQADESE